MTEAKLRQYVRRELLREDYGAYMSAQDLYDIFDSIKDVWEVTKVAIKDVLSAAVYVYDVAVAVNGEEIEKARNRYKVDKDKIIDEYAGALKSVQDRMGKDFHMVAFLAAPGPYLLAQTYDKGPQVTKDIVKFLAEAGMDFEMPGKSAKGDPEGTDTGIQQGAYDAIYGKKSNYTQAQFTNLSGQIETALNKIFGVHDVGTPAINFFIVFQQPFNESSRIDCAYCHAVSAKLYKCPIIRTFTKIIMCFQTCGSLREFIKLQVCLKSQTHTCFISFLSTATRFT